MTPSGSNDELIARADDSYRRVCATERELFADLAEIDRRDLWRGTEASCMAHWVSMRYGISSWKAIRWVEAAHALDSLPLVAGALRSGEMGLDRVVELTRLCAVSPDPEASLLRWAGREHAGAIRARADRQIRWTRAQVKALSQERSLSWGFEDEGRRFRATLEAPAAEGAVFIKAIEAEVARRPCGPDEATRIELNRADALIALASARIAEDPEPDRATIVIHARAEGLGAGGTGTLEGAGVIDAPSLERLGCHARLQVVLEDARGDASALRRMRRVPSAAMLRQLRYRDRDCRFPRCGNRRFTNAHHVVHWARGGPTNLENLVLLCTFHHRLVHEYGWGVRREPDGSVSWFFPDGFPYRAGPTPQSEGAAGSWIEPEPGSWIAPETEPQPEPQPEPERMLVRTG